MRRERPAEGWPFQEPTTHPGVILEKEFMQSYGLSQNKLASMLRVPNTRIGEIIHGRRAITPDTALRLSVLFDTSPEFWLNLQQMHDLSKAKIETAAEIRREVRALPVAAAV